VLKECMVWFRGLGLLGRLRGVGGGLGDGIHGDGSVPWHLGVAISGADALQGFLE
jgi:mediator of RNA polymerase II transcription subunit 13